MNKQLVVLTLAAFASAAPAYSQAMNVILFVGDGAGISSLNAASIYGYGKPQALYIQKMPHLALVDIPDSSPPHRALVSGDSFCTLRA